MELQNTFHKIILGFLALIVIGASIKAGFAQFPANEKSDPVYIGNECVLKEWKVSTADYKKYGGSDEAIKAKNLKPVRTTPCISQ